MLHSILRKILLTIPLLLLVSVMMFTMINLLPGNAAMVILGDAGGSVEQLEQLEEKLGLDQPLHVQYLSWLKRFVSGDMGTSYLTNQPVLKRIQERLPVTLELILLSTLLAVLIGIPAGILCAVRRNQPIDYLISTLSMIGVAIPQFWLGILFILLFSAMLMPSVVLALSLSAPIARQTRSAMLDTLNQDYIMTARAKGQRDLNIFLVHALRNALVPVITAITSQINSMIGGVFVIETLFLLPGMGKSMVDAIFQQDYPIVMGIAMVVVSCIVLINLITDVIYIFIDPRISLSKR